MPGQNLHKLTKSELKQLRAIVYRIYGREQGLTEKDCQYVMTDRECDKIIESLLPETVERLHEMGESRGFLSAKKFFLPSTIVAINGAKIMREDE